MKFDTRELAAGAFFISLGALAVFLSANYSPGSAERMGPGYYPRLLGGILIVLGSLMAIRAFRSGDGRFSRINWRPTVIVLLSVVFFGVAVRFVGAVIASAVLVFFASMASPEFRPREAIVSGILLAIFASLVFVVGLGVQLPLFPSFD